MSSLPLNVALKISQFPLHPSIQREQRPLDGATLWDRLTDWVASFALGRCKFILYLHGFGSQWTILSYLAKKANKRRNFNREVEKEELRITLSSLSPPSFTFFTSR
jgi:hypothetical protein